MQYCQSVGRSEIVISPNANSGTMLCAVQIDPPKPMEIGCSMNIPVLGGREVFDVQSQLFPRTSALATVLFTACGASYNVVVLG